MITKITTNRNTTCYFQPNLEIADVKIIAEDGDVGRLVHESGTVETSDQTSGFRVDHEDGSADGVDHHHEAVGGRGQASRDVDEPDADAVNELATVAEKLQEKKSRIS